MQGKGPDPKDEHAGIRLQCGRSFALLFSCQELAVRTEVEEDFRRVEIRGGVYQ